MIRFSIISVTRDNLGGLKATGESLEAQTFQGFEWIVIDGASRDGTQDYLATTKSKWISEPDTGIYDAMNKGIAIASGDYLLFLNAGDALAGPGTLKDVADGIRDDDFIYGDSLEDGHIRPARPPERALLGMFAHHQALFYRRAVIGDLRYDTAYRIAADYKFTLEFLKNAGAQRRLPFPVCVFAPGGVSQRRARLGRVEQFRIRRELGVCALPVNTAIALAQTLLMALRRAAPGLYWRLRTGDNRLGNQS